MSQVLWTAAQESGVEVAEYISLPFSFTTLEAPLESVAVLSGTARERITDVEFADDDTDASLGQELESEGARETRDLRTAGKDFLGALGAVAQLGLTKATKVLREVTEETTGALREVTEKPDENAQVAVDAVSDSLPLSGLDVLSDLTDEEQEENDAERRMRKRQTGLAVLGAIGIVLIGNGCMLSMATMLDFWNIFEIGWPIEIFLVTLALFGIMYTTSSIWMLIPSGIIFGTGMILAYCSVLDTWEHWVFLWVFELLIIVGSIWTPVWVAANVRLSRGLSRLVAIVGGLLSVVMVLGISFVVGVGGLLDLIW
jgi:hypothetical protein